VKRLLPRKGPSKEKKETQKEAGHRKNKQSKRETKKEERKSSRETGFALKEGKRSEGAASGKARKKALIRKKAV